MRHRTQLSARLGTHFTVGQAAAAGIGRGRVASRDLDRPFHGVRAVSAPSTPLQRVTALAARLRPGQLIGGKTAMHVWGYPHPDRWDLTDDIVVVVPTTAARVRTRGVSARRLATARAEAWRLDRIPVIDPIAALFMCAAALDRDQIIVTIEAMITTADNYPDLRDGRPVLTTTDIEERLQAWGRFPGSRRVREALQVAREGVESPKETETRLRIVEAGLPEPTVQYEVRENGRLVARSDMAYPELKIAIEYEGDGHRTSRDQWRRDVQRQRDLEDLGWIVIRVTQLDLDEGGRSLVVRLRRAISSRS